MNSSSLKNIGSQLIPWCVSAGALIYVFGFKIDWQAIPQATAQANMPLFIAITVFDKISFFLFWALLQADTIRRFIEKVSYRKVIAVKGASELVRTVNNSAADATFLYGVSQLVHSASMARVIAIASIPFIVHLSVLLIQATLALPFLDGGIAFNRDVAIGVAGAWALVFVASIGVRLGYLRRLLQRLGVGAWIDRVQPRELLPCLGWFALFSAYDILIQGLAARAFGLEIGWVALAARIPLLYVALAIPSLGNFGTREIAFANLYSNFGEADVLYAFALWTNTIFLVMHVIVGSLFLSHAIGLVREVRAARREGLKFPNDILHDASDR